LSASRLLREGVACSQYFSAKFRSAHNYPNSLSGRYAAATGGSGGSYANGGRRASSRFESAPSFSNRRASASGFAAVPAPATSDVPWDVFYDPSPPIAVLAQRGADDVRHTMLWYGNDKRSFWNVSVPWDFELSYDVERSVPWSEVVELRAGEDTRGVFPRAHLSNAMVVMAVIQDRRGVLVLNFVFDSVPLRDALLDGTRARLAARSSKFAKRAARRSAEGFR